MAFLHHIRGLGLGQNRYFMAVSIIYPAAKLKCVCILSCWIFTCTFISTQDMLIIPHLIMCPDITTFVQHCSMAAEGAVKTFFIVTFQRGFHKLPLTTFCFHFHTVLLLTLTSQLDGFDKLKADVKEEGVTT